MGRCWNLWVEVSCLVFRCFDFVSCLVGTIVQRCSLENFCAVWFGMCCKYKEDVASIKVSVSY